MLTPVAITLPSVGVLVLAAIAIAVLVILWKTLKLAIKVGLIVLVGFLLYQAAVFLDLL